MTRIDLSKLSQQDLATLGEKIKRAMAAEAERRRQESEQKGIDARVSSRLAAIDSRLAALRDQLAEHEALREALLAELSGAQEVLRGNPSPHDRTAPQRQLRDAQQSLEALDRGNWKSEATPRLLWSVAGALGVDLLTLRRPDELRRRIEKLEEERERLTGQAA